MTPRLFPPELLTTAIARLTAEITRRKHLHTKRRHRSYPRVVKRARHNSYTVKQAHHVGVRHTGPPTIDLVNLKMLARTSKTTNTQTTPMINLS